jgi:hypothetical protein
MEEPDTVIVVFVLMTGVGEGVGVGVGEGFVVVDVPEVAVPAIIVKELLLVSLIVGRLTL